VRTAARNLACSVAMRHGTRLEEDSDVPPVRSSRGLVFLVDEDVRATRTVAQMLREDGYEVERAADGAAAVGRLARDPIPDVLVTEITMPHVDGVAVVRYARSRRPGMPVICVTNHPELLARTTWSLVPSPIVLTKPIDYGALAVALSQVLGALVRVAAS
jgi:CheY-like chemotaxis protein